jgi:integrase
MLHDRRLAPATRGHYLAKLRGYLFYLADEGLLAKNPMNLIRPADFPRRPSLLPRALQPAVDAELRARLTAATDMRCRGLLLMRHTGLRVGELATLRLDCVHEDHKGHRYLKVPLGKLKKERLVPLNDEGLSLAIALQEQGRDDRKWLIESPRTKKPFGTARYHETMREIREGIPTPDGIRITTHRMRHTFATELLSGGLSLAAIRQLLGHRSMNMTLRYVSLTPDRLRQEYLAANTKARERYGKVPAAPRAAQLDDERTSAEAIADIVRQIKRDAAELSEEQKARARRAVRQLKNLGILLDELGL